MPHFTYILQCSDLSWYTGYTTDLERRLALHQSGKGAKYTRAHGASHYVATWQFDTKSQAMAMEYRIKKMSRGQKERLVLDDDHPNL